MVLGSIGSICALFLVVRYFCFYMVLYGIWFFSSSSFGCLIIIFIFVVLFLFYFFSRVLASSTIFYIFVCFHPGFNPLSSICFLYRSSVFSMPLCFSLASPFLFPVLVFSLFAKFLIYHECMHDCCLEIHCALIRIAIAYYK